MPFGRAEAASAGGPGTGPPGAGGGVQAGTQDGDGGATQPAGSDGATDPGEDGGDGGPDG